MKSSSSDFDVSIIIVNYNTKQLTLNCLESIIKFTEDIKYEVIIIDNASKDGSKELFEKDNRITYIYSMNNLGFGKANNVGLTLAKGRNILFLNSDTILLNNAIKILSDYLDNNYKVGACGGNLYNNAMLPTHSFRRNMNPLFIELDRLLRNQLRHVIYGKNFQFNHSKSPLSVSYICGADLMVRSCILNTLNGFSPNFFMYYEETDLCYRIKELHYKIKVIPEAKIIHLEGGSIKKGNDDFNYRVWSMMCKSRKIFNRLHYSKLLIKFSEIIMILNYKLTGLFRRNSKIDYDKLLQLYKNA